MLPNSEVAVVEAAGWAVVALVSEEAPPAGKRLGLLSPPCCGAVVPNNPAEDLGASAGGAPAGVVEAPGLKRGFAGVVLPAAPPNNPPDCELGALVEVGVEALLLFCPNKLPDEKAFDVGVDEEFAAVVGGVVVELPPNNPPDEAGLAAPPPKMLVEPAVGVCEPPNSPPVDGVVEAPNKGFCSAGLLAVLPNKPPVVFEDVGVVVVLLLLLGVLEPNEKLVALPPAPVPEVVVDCPPKILVEEDVVGVVVEDVPKREPEAGALDVALLLLLFWPEEPPPKLKDMIAFSVCSSEFGMECGACQCVVVQ